MEFKHLRYENTDRADFYTVLRSRVNAYFKDNNVSRYANANMVIKTVFMISLYVVPFVMILTVFDSWFMIMLMWVLTGFGMSGIGLSIMHDANHNAYSRNPAVNRVLGKLLNVIGGSDTNWRIQHNVLHHTYTNVSGMDEDIDAGALLRFSPNQKHRKGHRYQFLYAWFLYSLMTIMWVFSKDYQQYARYRKNGLVKTQKANPKSIISVIIMSKLLYLGTMITLPLVFCSAPWWFTILGFVVMHLVCGLMLSLIFQPAHVVPSSAFPEPAASGNIEADWAVSQLLNTANFAPKSRLFSWYVGGLNYQVEHHLFPNICHVHYHKISHIVRDTAIEYNLPYYSYKTFLDALGGHAKFLYQMGKPDPAVQVAKK